jgi:predicted alpha/beta superfamily hydrolase
MARLNKTRQLHPVIPGRVMRTEPFKVTGLPAEYALSIYIPPHYDRSDELFPVAYMFDGQNLFGDEGTYSGGWHFHDALEARSAAGKVVPLVVGIHHGGVTRLSEFSPWNISDFEGKGGVMLDWIVNSVMPMIESEWRVQRGPQATMIGGSSLGGLMSLFGFITYPGRFGKVMSMSPSVWVGEGELIRHATPRTLPFDRKVYIDAGFHEKRTIIWCQAMVAVLRGKGMLLDDDLKWVQDLDGEHNEPTWRKRLPDALKWLYG